LKNKSQIVIVQLRNGLIIFLDFAHRLTTIEDLATRDNVINVPVALPTGYVVNRPSQNIAAAGDRVDVNKEPSKEVFEHFIVYSQFLMKNLYDTFFNN